MSDRFIDPAVADIPAIRAAMLQEAGGDVAELMRRVADHQRHSDRQIIREPLRKRTEQSGEPEPPNTRVLRS